MNAGAAGRVSQVEFFGKLSGFLHDMDASLTVPEWSYETAKRAGVLLWVRKKGQTACLSGEWRHLFAA